MRNKRGKVIMPKKRLEKKTKKGLFLGQKLSENYTVYHHGLLLSLVYWSESWVGQAHGKYWLSL